MAVDHVQVLHLIAHYQARASTASDPIKVNEAAFREIQRYRQTPGVSANESIAAAEHYLFARFMVSTGTVSRQQMDAMVMGYDGVKFLAQQTETTEKWMRHNPANPTSKVSPASVVWGLKGCADGEADRLKHLPTVDVPTWNWEAMKFGGFTDKVANLGSAVTGSRY
jgi:hypothetical protein